MKSEHKVRKYAGWFLGVTIAWQFYFVRELTAAFLFFALAFAAVALVIAYLYILQKGCEMLATRFVDARRSAAQAFTTEDPTQGIS